MSLGNKRKQIVKWNIMGRTGCYFTALTGSTKHSTDIARRKWMDWGGQIAEKCVALVTAGNRKERGVRLHQAHNGRRRSGQQVLDGKRKQKN